MKIAGFQKVSLIDYPDVISSVIFTQGCNFRCSYCHNAKLVLRELFEEPLDNNYIYEYLEKREGQIEGITITGGEPTIHADLPEIIREFKKKGLKVKLDTNGSNPKMLEGLLENNLLDFIAMDVKATLNKYEEICESKVNIKNISESISLIKNSGIKRQFRTTFDSSLLSIKDISEIKAFVLDELVLQEIIYSDTMLKKYLS